MDREQAAQDFLLDPRTEQMSIVEIMVEFARQQNEEEKDGSN